VTRKLLLQKEPVVFLSLRQIGGQDAIDALAIGFTSSSVLLSHEVAYCLGQMQDPKAIPLLTSILDTSKYHVIFRHEAAEALGAIGDPDSIKILEKYAQDTQREISETCNLAIARIKWLQENKNQTKTESKEDSPSIQQDKKRNKTKTSSKDKDKDEDERNDSSDDENEFSPYDSVDPAPPLSNNTTVDDLKKILVDSSLPLFQRYRAMFALRNKNNEEAAVALASSFTDTEDSAIFKHEIAYVLGQMQIKNPTAVAALKKILEDSKEHEMVRHEAAEALGSIADARITPVLQKFQLDSQRIVKESCDVALDIQDYWTSEQTDEV